MANTLWQVIAAYIFAVVGGSISASLLLEHKALCALISFAAGTLLGVTIFAILPESFGACPWWAALLALTTGYALFFFISKHVHHVCPACAASHFDADATRHFSEIANALIVALAIHSTTDGLALGIQGETTATGAAKWSLFSALCIHKVPEGLALGSLLIGSGRSHHPPRRCHRLFLPDKHLRLVAWLDYGARRRRVYLFGDTCGGRRDVEARKEARFDELYVGGRSNRRSQCWLASAWVAHASRVLARPRDRENLARNDGWEAVTP
jgi:hypothetical protein